MSHSSISITLDITDIRRDGHAEEVVGLVQCVAGAKAYPDADRR
jgi:hypothetical protein